MSQLSVSVTEAVGSVEAGSPPVVREMEAAGSEQG